MTEADDPTPGAEPGGSADLLQYDFFKHITSLSLVSLGGVLLVVPELDPTTFDRWKVLATFLLISAGGIGAFHGASEIVKSRTTLAPPSRSIKWLRRLTPSLLAAGVGVFLSVFVDTLD